MSRRKQKKANQKAYGGLPAVIINGWGFHQLPPAPTPPYVPPVPEPHITDAGNGWWTVHGGEHGPYDRYGRENAEQCLAAVVAARAARK